MLDIVAIQKQLSTRRDLYGTIHRGLRKAEMELLARLGALDATDTAAVNAIVADCRQILILARFHLVGENEHIHAAIETVRPGSAAAFARYRQEREKGFAEIEAILVRVEKARGEERGILVKALYLRTTRFVADDFLHMLDEETELQPLLQVVFSDVELAAIESRIVASIPPTVLLDFIRIMVPAIDPRARHQMLFDMMQRMPAEAFHAVLDLAVKPVLSDADWRRLNGGLRDAA